MRFYHVAHFMKRIEILLSHIRYKNKLIIDFFVLFGSIF